MKQAKWLFIVLSEHLGWQGLAGLAFLIFAASHYFTQVRPLANRVDELGLAASGRPLQSKFESRKELESFRASLQQGTLEDQLKDLNDSGKSAGLAFKRIEYRMLEEKRFGLKQYQISMPITSTYPSVRRFTSMALSRMPGLSLDNVNFQRRRIGDAAVDVELRFTLFLADPT